ncbi:MAG: hypothetical protein V7676_04685 [Parasphingorhabdus sp.]|uniref:hypothetical protein n=1 Tax=Parasphingorhabdus sp. TaxID=2709688 RepID=UPI0030015E00
MTEPKPLASLSSSLLARKGGAKPAMRRQGMAFPSESHHENEDLGWNDMGYDVNPDHEAVQTDGYNGTESDQYHYNPLAGAIPDVVPAVRKQQEEIAAKLSQQPMYQEEVPAAPEPEVIAPVVPKASSENVEQAVPVPLSISREVAPVAEHSKIGKTPTPRKTPVETPQSVKVRAPAKKSRTRNARAAFTLRLDPDRHLKLRLATAMKNISAQQLVTKAVDEYLKSIPELEDLAGRIPSRGAA